MDSPPPSGVPPRQQRSKPKSLHGDDSDDSGNEVFLTTSHTPTSTLSRRTCKNCRKYQQQSSDLQERVCRLEKDNEGLKKELRAAQNTDLQYSNLLRDNERLRRDNERLRQDLKKINRGSEHDIDSRILERQVEELETELQKKREVIADLKGYKKDFANLRQKYEAHHQGLDESGRCF